MKTLYLKEMKNPGKKKVLIYLQKYGKAVFCKKIRAINMWVTKEQEIILSLASHDRIRNLVKPSFLELTIERR